MKKIFFALLIMIGALPTVAQQNNRYVDSLSCIIAATKAQTALDSITILQLQVRAKQDTIRSMYDLIIETEMRFEACGAKSIRIFPFLHKKEIRRLHAEMASLVDISNSLKNKIRRIDTDIYQLQGKINQYFYDAGENTQKARMYLQRVELARKAASVLKE